MRFYCFCTSNQISWTNISRNKKLNRRRKNRRFIEKIFSSKFPCFWDFPFVHANIATLMLLSSHVFESMLFLLYELCRFWFKFLGMYVWKMNGRKRDFWNILHISIISFSVYTLYLSQCERDCLNIDDCRVFWMCCICVLWFFGINNFEFLLACFQLCLLWAVWNIQREYPRDFHVVF